MSQNESGNSFSKRRFAALHLSALSLLRCAAVLLPDCLSAVGFLVARTPIYHCVLMGDLYCVSLFGLQRKLILYNTK